MSKRHDICKICGPTSKSYPASRNENKHVNFKQRNHRMIHCKKNENRCLNFLEVIFTFFSFHVHETANHCIICNFSKFFFIHIANKSITQCSSTILLDKEVFTSVMAQKHLSTVAVATGSTNTSFKNQ